MIFFNIIYLLKEIVVFKFLKKTCQRNVQNYCFSRQLKCIYGFSAYFLYHILMRRERYISFVKKKSYFICPFEHDQKIISVNCSFSFFTYSNIAKLIIIEGSFFFFYVSPKINYIMVSFIFLNCNRGCRIA